MAKFISEMSIKICQLQMYVFAEMNFISITVVNTKQLRALFVVWG